MDTLSRYQVDHLLLLLGKNPLPNAVAGKLLVKPGGRITLLYTDETSRVIDHLKAFLAEIECNAHVKIKEADAHSIYQGVYSVLNGSEGKSIGLHYTGGTKAMSVHAYAAVKRWQDKGGHPAPIFSYLDARKLEIVIDPDDPLSDTPKSIPVGKADVISLRQMIGLHGWSYKKEGGRELAPITMPLFPKTASDLAELHSSDEGAKAWREWKNSEGAKFDFGNDEKLSGIWRALEVESGAKLLADIIGPSTNISRDELRKWLDGKWLESHVLQCLLDLNDEDTDFDLKDCCREVRTNEVDFEVDVIARRGYQLYAFACTTTKHEAQIKLKIFEVFVRARQLGGDEARIALVCAHAEPESLQAEIHNEFDSEGRVRVFGQRHLKDLKAALAGWIKKQSGTS